jgi:hypothetical protein
MAAIDMGSTNAELDKFLKPLPAINPKLVLKLAKELGATFKRLSTESKEMFLPTPISESILRPVAGKDLGR